MKTQSLLLGAALLALSSPALADHMGPSGVGSGGQFVFGPETLDEGHASLGLRLTYSRPERRSDEELEALAEQGIAAHNTDYNLNAALGAAYGITHELTVSGELPYVRRDHLREGGDGEVERLGSVSGVGDLSLLAKYRLTHGEGIGFALVAGIKAPTGSTHRRSPDGERLETEHQPGTGSWDPIFGATAATKAGPLQFSASALYQVSGKGAQHTQLGDRFQGGVAVSHHFGPSEHEAEGHSLNHHHGDELDGHSEGHVHSSWDAFVELSGDWEGRQRIEGEIEEASGGKSVWLSPGARFNSADGFSFGASLGVPVWQRIRASHPNNNYRLTFSVGRAF